MKFLMPMPILKTIGVLNNDTDVEYTSFADAQKLPFANKHNTSVMAATTLRVASKKKQIVDRLQVPSSRTSIATIITKLKNKTNFKIGVASKDRGVVECNTCQKPRCIYSLPAVSCMKPPLPQPNDLNDQRDEALPSVQDIKQYQTLATGRLLADAVESPIFLCGI
jgi:hypothetical protein